MDRRQDVNNPEHFTHLNKVAILLLRLRQIYLNRTDHNNIFLTEYIDVVYGILSSYKVKPKGSYVTELPHCET